MLRCVVLLTMLLTPIVSLAQLDMQDEYRPHRMILAEYRWTPQGDQEIDLLWDVPEGVDYEQVGNRLFIWAAPMEARYDLRLTTQTKTFEEVELANGDKRRFLTQATIQTHRKRFFVRGSTTPPPKPDDPDKPPPDDPGPDPIPEGYLGFAAKAFELAMNVPVNYRKMKVEVLASNFARVAKSTAHPRDMVAEIIQRNRDSLPETTPGYSAWRSAFFEPWEQYAGQLTQSGEFVHITSEFQKVFEATAQGLEHAKEVPIQEEITCSPNKRITAIPEYKLRNITNEPDWQKQNQLWQELLA